MHKGLIREGIEEQWRQLEAMRIVVEEVAAEFDGEDPALPDVRHMLDHTTERLVDLHRDAQIYAEPFELGEPGDGDIAAMREQVDREVDAAQWPEDHRGAAGAGAAVRRLRAADDADLGASREAKVSP